MKRFFVLLMLFGVTGGISLQGFPGGSGSISVSSDLPVTQPASGLESVRRITLSQAIDVALANNPELHALEWDVKAAAARSQSSAGKRLPELKLTGAYTYNPDGQRLIAKRSLEDLGVFTRNVGTADLTITLPLFAGGRFVNEIKSSELLYLASTQHLSRSRNELVFNVTSTYFRILAQEQVVKSIEFSLKSLKHHLAAVKALVQAEKVAKVDQLRTEVRLADLSEQLLKARNTLAIQLRVFTSLLGVEDPALSFQLTGNLTVPDIDKAVPELKTALATAMANRHDLQALQHEVTALEHSFKAAKGERYPLVSLQGSYGERWALNPINVGDDASGNLAYLGINIKLPLYSGGRLKARIRESKSEFESAKNRYHALQQKILLEVESALLNLSAAKMRIAASENSVTQAKESFRIETLKYQASMGTMVDVLESQAALLAAQTNYYSSLSDFRTSMAQLNFSMGKIR